MQEISGNLLRGHLESLILSVLEPGAAHGLEVLRRLQDGGAGALQLKEGSLYPALYRLENSGLLRAEWEGETPGRRGPRRRIYHLTDEGRRVLSLRRQEWRKFVRTLDSFLGAA